MISVKFTELVGPHLLLVKLLLLLSVCCGRRGKRRRLSRRRLVGGGMLRVRLLCVGTLHSAHVMLVNHRNPAKQPSVRSGAQILEGCLPS